MAYSRVNWEDLLSTNTPINAENLNVMDQGIKDLETETNNRFQQGYKGQRLEYNSLNAFKDDIITNSFPVGVYLTNISYSQNNYAIIVNKATNYYLSFILFNYATTAKQYRYVNGTWYEASL